ncbi:MAG: lysophospholipid acyltransferase family protein [Polyangiaceae bacterium]|nr:lysophospholipid acyltransferase family protein [Polyangiaceae bacterium]
MREELLRRALVAGASRAPAAVMATLPAAIGAVAWALSPVERRGVRENLRAVLAGESRGARLAAELRTFTSYASSLAEGVAVLADPGRRVTLEIEGRAHLDAALSDGRGVVLLTAHTTGFELAGAALARQIDRRVAFVMAKERDDGARGVSDALRARAGLEVLHVGADALDALPVLRALRGGVLVGMHVDRVPAGMSASPPWLFGRPLARGPLLLASRARVGAVPVWTRREGPFRVRICASPAVRVGPRATTADVDAALAQVASSLCAWIRADPAAWMDWRR